MNIFISLCILFFYIGNICVEKSVYSLQSSTEGNHILKAKAGEKIPPYVRAPAGDTVLILLRRNITEKINSAITKFVQLLILLSRSIFKSSRNNQEYKYFLQYAKGIFAIVFYSRKYKKCEYEYSILKFTFPNTETQKTRKKGERIA